MSARNWKFYYKSNNEVPKRDWIDIIFLWMAIGLFWLSFFSIIGEIYPAFVPDKSICFLLVPWIFLLWLVYERIIPKVKKRRWVFKVVALVANVILFFAFYLWNTKKLFGGSLAVLQRYLEDYNYYYKTTYAVAGGEYEYMAMAFTFLAFVIFLLLWSLSYAIKKRWILMFFPIVAIVLELAVGQSPKGVGVDYLFVGAIMLFSENVAGKRNGQIQHAAVHNRKIRSQRLFTKILIIVVCVLSLLISNVAYKEKVLSLVAKKPELLKFQEYVLSGQWLDEKGSILDIQFDKENLSNAKRSDKGATVLELKMNSRPYAAIYLKGYYGTTYENATWTMDNHVLLDVCREQGVSSRELAKVLFNSGYDQNVRNVDFEIKYKNSLGNVAYTPYFTSYESLDNAYPFTGDFVLDKSIGDKIIRGTCINPTNNGGGMYTLSTVNYSGEYFKGYEWYDEVLDAYLEVPSSIYTLFTTMKANGELHLVGVDDIVFDPTSSVGMAGNVVSGVARNIRSCLHELMSYSQDLDELPMGTDPIEYALTKGHEGYCMHFASAGTMMFRYAGIPARYVSGYVAFPSEFEETSDGYVAVVKDYNAHAWVEIFVDGLGWVPVEVTPGYENGTEKPPTENETLEESEESKESEDTEDIEETQRTEESANTENTQDNSSEETSSETEESSNTQSGDEGPAIKEDKWWAVMVSVLKILLVVAVCAVLLLLLYLSVKRYLKHYHEVLLRQISRKHTRRAIKRMHKRIYGYLRIRKHVIHGLRDKEIEKLLMETFADVAEEDWQRYMEIVKKMHYSTEEILEEEMMHCYQCYKMVTGEFFKKKKSSK